MGQSPRPPLCTESLQSNDHNNVRNVADTMQPESSSRRSDFKIDTISPKGGDGGIDCLTGNGAFAEKTSVHVLLAPPRFHQYSQCSASLDRTSQFRFLRDLM